MQQAKNKPKRKNALKVFRSRLTKVDLITGTTKEEARLSSL